MVGAHLKLDIWQQFARFDEQTAALQLCHLMRTQPCTPQAHSLTGTGKRHTIFGGLAFWTETGVPKP